MAAQMIETREGADRAPLLRCEITHEVWGPHTGCKEFMTEPDVFPCAGWATIRLTWTELVPYAAPPLNIETCGMLLCIDCAMGHIDTLMSNAWGELRSMKITHIADEAINPEEGK